MSQANGQSVTLQDSDNATARLPEETISVAKEVVTPGSNKPSVGASAVVGDRILTTGRLEEMEAAAGHLPYTIGGSFGAKDNFPGFLA